MLGEPASEDRSSFLQLTFNGKRFEQHSAPVDVLVELSTMQELITRVARHLYLEAHPERRRVPRGFAEAAQLHVRRTEDNCFSVELLRPNPMRDADGFSFFEQARDLSMEALRSAAESRHLPDDLPSDAFDLLAAFGRRLRKDESVIVRAGRAANGPRIDHRSRSYLAQLAQRPLEFEGDLEGEIDTVDDANGRFWLRTDYERVEVPFARGERAAVLDALLLRPAVRVRIRCIFTVSQPQMSIKVKAVKELETNEAERAVDVLILWKRLEDFDSINDGWAEGTGSAPTAAALEQARGILGRLLVSASDVPKPSIFPTPEGGVQAEWSLGDWQVELVFDAEGHLSVEATNARTLEEREAATGTLSVSRENTEALALWLLNLSGDSQRVDD